MKAGSSITDSRSFQMLKWAYPDAVIDVIKHARVSLATSGRRHTLRDGVAEAARGLRILWRQRGLEGLRASTSAACQSRRGDA